MTRQPDEMPGFGKKVTTPSPMDVQGRPEAEAGPGGRAAYGEPKGPKPPRFETRSREEIDERARRHVTGDADAAAPSGSRLAGDRERQGYHSGMTTGASLETTGDQIPQVVQPREADDER